MCGADLAAADDNVIDFRVAAVLQAFSSHTQIIVMASCTTALRSGVKGTTWLSSGALQEKCSCEGSIGVPAHTCFRCEPPHDDSVTAHAC